MEGFTTAEAESQPLLGAEIAATKSNDPHSRDVIDFDPVHDTDNPHDWPTPFKWLLVALLALTNFTVTFTCVSVVAVSTIIARDLSPTDTPAKSASVLLVTIWELGEAAGPLFIAPLSERLGRVPVIAAANGAFIAFTAFAALARSPNQFIAARFLTGLAVACNVLNPAVVGDIFVPERRGAAISIIMFAPLIGGAVGPLISGAVSETLGWRSVMWGGAVMMGLCQVLFLLMFKETYKVVILRKRAARLRRETGNEALRTAFDVVDGEKGGETFWEAVMRPVRVFRGSGVLMWMALFGSVLFSYYYVMSVTLADIMQDVYGFSPAAAGSTFMCFSVGSLISTTFCHATLDRIYVHLKRSHKGIDRPEFRLPLVVVGAFTVPIAIAIYGWCAELRLPAPFMLGSVILMGITLILTIVPLMSYVVDAFGMYSASAITGLIVSRCIMATFLPMTTTPLIGNLGYGWGMTVLAALSLSVAPIPVVVWRYGHRWRQMSEFTREK